MLQRAVKAVAFQYEPSEPVEPLLKQFRMMVNHALWVGMRKQIRGRFKLIRAVYADFRRYGLHTHYTLSACEVASAILRNHRRNHRAPTARRLTLKLDNQTYRLQGNILRIPVRPREFLNLRLNLGQYQRNLLDDASLKFGSITLTENKVVIALSKTQRTQPEHGSVIAYDTNELSLDGAFSNQRETRLIHVDLRQIAKIRAFHFDRRRQLQKRLAQCRRKLRAKHADDRALERRRVDAVLHRVAKNQVNIAKENNARIVLEDLKGVRRTVNKRISKINPHSGKLLKTSLHSKSLKRRLNSWPFRRLHAFIEYKANWEGVAIRYVPAKNTSRTCARCGCLLNRHYGELDPKTRQVFTCPECGFKCDRHLNAAFNLLKTQDEGRWFSPDRLPNEVMTAKRAYGEEGTPQNAEKLPEPNLPEPEVTCESDGSYGSLENALLGEPERVRG